MAREHDPDEKQRFEEHKGPDISKADDGESDDDFNKRH